VGFAIGDAAAFVGEVCTLGVEIGAATLGARAIGGGATFAGEVCGSGVEIGVVTSGARATGGGATSGSTSLTGLGGVDETAICSIFAAAGGDGITFGAMGVSTGGA
jgi:hypothetical protein